MELLPYSARIHLYLCKSPQSKTVKLTALHQYMESLRVIKECKVSYSNPWEFYCVCYKWLKIYWHSGLWGRESQVMSWDFVLTTDWWEFLLLFAATRSAGQKGAWMNIDKRIISTLAFSASGELTSSHERGYEDGSNLSWRLSWRQHYVTYWRHARALAVDQWGARLNKYRHWKRVSNALREHDLQSNVSKWLTMTNSPTLMLYLIWAVRVVIFF